MAYPAHEAEATCSHAGTFAPMSMRAATTTSVGATNAFERMRSRAPASRSGVASSAAWASASPNASRAPPLTTTKRLGRRPPWSGTVAATVRIASTCSALGAGGYSAAVLRRVRNGCSAATCSGVTDPG
jgi:hypothetical protein